jgi:hypothetical protein
MADHLFKLGQSVRLTRSLSTSTTGIVEVIRLMPEALHGEPAYRVRGADKVERAAGESQLTTLSSPADAIRR